MVARRVASKTVAGTGTLLFEINTTEPHFTPARNNVWEGSSLRVDYLQRNEGTVHCRRFPSLINEASFTAHMVVYIIQPEPSFCTG